MKIGIQCVISQGCVAPVEQAVEAHRRGFQLIAHGEHHHLPVSTPIPEFYQETGVPDFYRYVPDPLITLAAMATAAPGITVGTSILLLPIHDTIMIASRMASLDFMTGGRTMFGLGVGWNRPELQNHGVDFDTRVAKTREQLRAIKAMWSSETTAFDGEFVKFTESWQGPKPIQKPHPPLLLGGRPLKKNFETIAELCDGWLPTDTYARTFGGDLDKELKVLGETVEAAGRDPDSLQNMVLLAELMLYDRTPEQYAEDAPTRELLEYYEALGFEWVLIGVPSFSRGHFLGALDILSGVAAPWLERVQS